MPKIQGPKGPAVPTRVSAADKPATLAPSKPAAEGWKAKAPTARPHATGPAVASAPPRAVGTLHPKLVDLRAAADVFGADQGRATVSTEARAALPAMFARGALTTAPRAGNPTEARHTAS